MGRWYEVQCNCPNRIPLGHWMEGAYQCGHKDGMWIQFFPGDLFAIGAALEEAFRSQLDYFPVFRKIGDWRLYVDEYFSLAGEEVDWWELEIEQVRCYQRGEVAMGWHAQRAWDLYFQKSRLLYGDIAHTLATGITLCQASRQTGNPIEFRW